MRNFTSKAAAALFGMMMLAANANAQMVISKVFYSGTKTTENKNYNGKPEYIELHNNSDKEVDIAGYYIGLVESESGTGAYLAADQTNNDVKLKQVFQFPETSYVVPAWGNVVIAANAIDHTATAVDVPDLSKADFKFGGVEGDADVPALTLKYTYSASVTFFNITNGGDASIILINKSNGDKHLKFGDETALVYANGKEKGNQYLNFNAYYALDAVEIIKAKKNADTGLYEVDATRKRIKDSWDKGYVPVPGDASMLRDGYIAYRKTALNNDGKLYLYDTQNSCEDFAVAKGLAIYGYDNAPAGTTELTVTIPESGYLPFNAENYFFTEKGIHVTYITPDKANKVLKYVDTEGQAKVFNNSAYMLIGAPGEHKVFYTKADRNMATSGNDYWIADGDEKYADGVLTITTKERYPMKFVNEKSNVRFVRDMKDNNPQTLKIDLATEGRFYINLNYLNEDETTIPWGGIKPEDITTAISSAVADVPASDNAVYNLQGVRMNAASLPAGIYIQGGKKYVVK